MRNTSAERWVEVARIVATKPSFVLLDEPFAGVDPISVGEITNLITKLKNKNIGILITDHNVKQTLKIVDKAYIMYNGEILCHGTPNDIMSNKIVQGVYLGNDD